MNFANAGVIEDLCWSMKLADFPRSQNRAMINDLFNGVPPYTDEQVQRNRIDVNVNFLEGVKLAHDARRQFANAFLKAGNFFTVTLDCGPIEKRLPWSTIITTESNRILKRSRLYYETLRSTFAQLVLHGIGPKVFTDRERVIPKAIGVDDVMFPSQTLTSLENLEFFAIYRRFTATQLHRLTSGPNVDPAWQKDVVNACLRWAHMQGTQSLAYQDTYSPERIAELMKSDLGFYASDKVPTIDCWDFYHREDSRGVDGWTRRIVLDAFGEPGVGGIPGEGPPIYTSQGKKNLIGDRGQFLYNSGRRKVAPSFEQVMQYQFGDLSAVAPFRYHSVRGLGFLLYAVCHLQNRLRCRFNEAQFEHLLQYFRVSNPDDAERLEKIDLINRGIIPEGMEFVKAQDRWQINQQLIESGLAHNREIMGSNASSFIQDFDFGKERTEKTATQVMAEVNKASALVSAALNQAYSYAVWEFREIGRRLCIKNSCDPLATKFRSAVLRQGVPEKYLNSELWDIEPVRVLGSGDKTLAMAEADQLMQVRPLLDPEPQREVLRDYVLANTDDAARTDRLVPLSPTKITDSVHDAQLAMGPLMQGLPIDIKSGINRTEYVEAMMRSLLVELQNIEQTQQGMATPPQLRGLTNVIEHLKQNIQVLAQDESQKQKIKVYLDDLKNIENVVRGYAQRLQEMQEQQAEAAAAQNGQRDPADLQRLQIEQARGQIKIDQQREANAARTAERQTAFELEEKREEDRHQQDMRRAAEKAVIEDAAATMKAEAAAEATKKNGEKKDEG